MNLKSNIYTFLRYTNVINNLIGQKNVDIHHFKPMNNAYKTYVLFLSMILSIIFIIIIHVQQLLLVLKYFHVFSLNLAYALMNISMLLIFVVTQFESLLYGFRHSIVIFSLLIEIDHEIEFDKSKQNEGIEKSIIVTYIVYALVKFLNIYSNKAGNWFYLFLYHACSTNVDLHFIRFVLEVNFLTRSFEVLNQQLTINIPNTMFDIGDGILIRIW